MTPHVKRRLAEARKDLQNPSYRKVVEDFVAKARASGQCPSLFVQSQDELERQPGVNREQAELKREQTQMHQVEKTEQQKPDTGNAAAEPAPNVEVADKDGLGPKEYTKLNTIAERIAKAQGHEGVKAVEEEAEKILEEGVAVKVSGQSALLHDGLIHTQDGKQFPVPADLLADVAKFRRQRANTEIERLRPSEFNTASIAQAAIRGLRAAGIKVGVIIDPLAKHFASGEYATLLNGKGNAVQVIQWHVADAHNPTVDNLAALFHEAGHAVYAKMPPEIQAALQRAIRSFTNEQLHIGNFQEAIAKSVRPEAVPFVQQEGRLVEALARKLVQERFNPAEAMSVSQRVWKVIKDVARGVYMAVQKMSGRPPSAERAMEYFEHRVQMALRGEQPMSLLNFLGGSRMKMPDWDNPSTRYSGINQVSNPLKHLETKEGAPVGIAALNHFAETVMDMVHKWSLADTSGIDEGSDFPALHQSAREGGRIRFVREWTHADESGCRCGEDARCRSEHAH